MNTHTNEAAPAFVWMAPAAAARVLGVSRATAWRWAASGHLRSMRLGPRCLRLAVPRELYETARATANATPRSAR